MNIFDIANIQRRKGVSISRIERIKREGSPNYTYLLPVTATTVTVTIHIPTQFPDSNKYQPLDFVEIVNNDAACPLTVTINNADAYSCPIGTIRTIHGQGIALWQVAITNDGGVNTTINRIRLTLKKEAMTIDKWAADR